MKLSYSREAQDDLEAMYEYIAKKGGTSAADRMIDAVADTCEDLQLFPQMGRRRPELDDLGLEVRSINERGYLILYTTYRDTVHVVRVVHGSRDVDVVEFDGLINIVD